MENILDIVEQFLNLSDEKLEELAQKNHLLRLQEEEEKKNSFIFSDITTSNFL